MKRTWFTLLNIISSAAFAKAVDEKTFCKVNRLHFIQIPSKRLKKTQKHRSSNSILIFIDDKVLGFPVLESGSVNSN